MRSALNQSIADFTKQHGPLPGMEVQEVRSSVGGVSNHTKSSHFTGGLGNSAASWTTPITSSPFGNFTFSSLPTAIQEKVIPRFREDFENLLQKKTPGLRGEGPDGRSEGNGEAGQCGGAGLCGGVDRGPGAHQEADRCPSSTRAT